MADFFNYSPAIRGQRLEESLEYQQFVANVEEEEAWINEKMTLVASEDYGDTLAAIQVRDRGCCPLTTLFACLLSGHAFTRRAFRAVRQGLLGDSQSSGARVRDSRLCVDRIGVILSASTHGVLGRNPVVSPAVSLVSSPQVAGTSSVSCDCLNNYHKLGGFKNYRSLFCRSLGSQRSGIKVSVGPAVPLCCLLQLRELGL